MPQKIGVQAAFDVTQFSAGLSAYLKGLQQAQSATTGTASTVSRSGSDMSGSITSSLSTMGVAIGTFVGEQLVRLVDGFMDAARAAADFTLETVNLAGRASELGTVLDYIGQRFGVSTQEIDAQVEAMKEYGIRTDDARTILAQFIRYQLDAADAVKLARVAQDAAVLAYEDTSTALQGLLTGILTHQARTIRAHGIVIDLEEAERNYAKQLGLTRKELNAYDKTQAALNAVIEEGAAIQGVYTVAMEEPAKRLRSLSRYIYELQLNLGGPFVQAWGSAIDSIIYFVTTLTKATEEGTALNDLLREMGALSAVVGEGLLELAKQATDAGIAFMTEMGYRMKQAAENALIWGVNIAVQIGNGLIEGAVTAITAAMEFIASLLAAWLAPGSPPKVAPELTKWGTAAMEEFLRGFTLAKFDILEGIQQPLRSIFAVFVNLGRLAKEEAGPAFAEISALVAKSLNEMGKVSEEVLKIIRDSTGEYGDALVELVKRLEAVVAQEKEVEEWEKRVTAATKAQEEAERRLEQAQTDHSQAQTDVVRKIKEYNAMLRAGAGKDVLAAKLKEINAAEKREQQLAKEETEQEKLVQAAKLKREEEEAGLKDQRERLKLLRDQYELQRRLLEQLIAMMEAQVPPREPVARERRPRVPVLRRPAAEPRPREPIIPEIDAAGFQKRIDEAFEKLKERIRERMQEIFRPLTEAWDRWGEQLGAKWGVFTGFIDEMKPLFAEAVKPFERAWENFGTFWDSFSPVITASITSVIIALAGAIGTVLGTALAQVGPLVERFSQYLVEHGPEINAILAGLTRILVESAIPALAELAVVILRVAGWWLKKWQEMGLAVLSFWLKIAGILTADATVREKLAALMEYMRSLWQGYLDWFRENVAEKGAELLRPMLDAIRSNFEIMRASFQDLSAAVKLIWLTMWESLKGKAIEFFAGLGQTISNAWNAITTTVGTAIATVRDTIVGIASAIVLFLQTTWDNILLGISATWSTIIETIASVWNTIQEITSAVWDAIRIAIVAAIILILDLFGVRLEDLIVLWQETWAKINKTIYEVWASIVSFLKQTWEDIVKFFEDTVASIIKSAVEFGTKLFATVKKTVDDTKSVFERTWNAIKTMFLGIVNSILNIARNYFQRVYSEITYWISYTRDVLSSIWDNIWNKVVTTLSNILQEVIRFGKPLYEQLASAFNRALDAVIGTMKRIYDTVVNVFSNIITAVSNLATQFYNLGTNLIEKIFEGVRDRVQKLIDAVVNAIKEAIRRAKEVLGIEGGGGGGGVGERPILDVTGGVPITRTTGGIADMLNAMYAPRVPPGLLPNAGMNMPGGSITNSQVYNVNVNLGSVTIANGMDMATFEARVQNVVRKAITRP